MISEIMGYPEEGTMTLIIDPPLDDTDSESQPTQLSGESLEELDRRLLNESEMFHYGLEEVHMMYSISNETSDESSITSNSDVSIRPRRRSNSVSFAGDNKILGHAGYEDERVKNALHYNAEEVASFHSEFMEEMFRANKAGMTWKEWMNSRTDRDWEHEMRRYRLRNLDKETLRLPLPSRRKDSDDMTKPVLISNEKSFPHLTNLTNDHTDMSVRSVDLTRTTSEKKSAFSSDGRAVLKRKLFHKKQQN